jgi:hypothetical protein
MTQTKDKAYMNSLIATKLLSLSAKEKQEMILELLKTRTERELGAEIGVPQSTIHDWKTLRQSCKGKDMHISLSGMYRKLKDMKAEDVTDWGRLELIKEEIERLLIHKK